MVKIRVRDGVSFRVNDVILSGTPGILSIPHPIATHLRSVDDIFHP